MITPHQYELMKQAVLDNFHPPSDSHPAWHLNPGEVVNAVLAVVGLSAPDQPEPVEDPAAILMASYASRGWKSRKQLTNLVVGMPVRKPFNRAAELIAILTKDDAVELIVRHPGGDVSMWLPLGVREAKE